MDISTTGSSSSATMPPSPCATSTTTTPSDSRRIDFTFSGGSIENSNYGKKYSMRFPSEAQCRQPNFNSPPLIPPSPSRSTLDPEYAKRLFPSNRKNTNPRHLDRDPMILSPPPGIHRMWGNSSSARRQPSQKAIFRTPETSVSGSGGDDDEDDDEAEVANDMLTPRSNSTGFFTPERGSAGATSILPNRPSSLLEDNSTIAVPTLLPRLTLPKSPPSRYYTPHISPRRLNDGMLSINNSPAVRSQPRLISSLNRESNSNGPLDTGGNTSEHHRLDRFIPSRSSSNLHFSVWNPHEEAIDGGSRGAHVEASSSGATVAGGIDGPGGGIGEGAPGSGRADTTMASQHTQYQSQQPPLLNALLRSELLGENIDPTPGSPTSQSRSSGLGLQHHQGGPDTPSLSSTPRRHDRTPLREGGNFLRFQQSPRQTVLDELYRGGAPEDPTSAVNSFSLSPVGIASSNRLSSMPQKRKRRIAKVPFKVLDAPALADDFYLNLVDWSLQNVLAVGLGSCVYLWSACTSKVTKLCDLGTHTQDAVTSVAWTQRGIHLAVGVHNGDVQIWDTIKCRRVRIMQGHSARIGALSWSGPILASGSRDRLIYLRDVRSQQPYTTRLAAHKQEVCGLKWSFDEPAHLASGGNDNKLLVWDIKMQRQPAHKFAEHTAAVKAIAWSPHQHGLLASGGGTADRCIRFWNALSGSALNAVDTGSQVCNLAWSQNCNELVSTHGYSLNQIAIWKYPTMQKVATLTGHTYRVLYLAMSPDGSTIVTGAGDETLRFWQVFPGPRSHDKTSGNGLLFPSSPGSILR